MAKAKGKISRANSYKPHTPKPWYKKTWGICLIIFCVAVVATWIYSSVTLKIERKKYQPKHVRTGKMRVAKGVTKDIIIKGTGEKAKFGDSVKVHFQLRAPDNQILQSSHDGEPFLLQIGGNVFEGLSLAVASMKVGEKSKFVMEPSVLSQPIKNALPRGSQLIAEIELLEILP